MYIYVYINICIKYMIYYKKNYKLMYLKDIDEFLCFSNSTK